MFFLSKDTYASVQIDVYRNRIQYKGGFNCPDKLVYR